MSYLQNIKYYCLIMSEYYIRNHLSDIREHANIIEQRLDDRECTLENVLENNAFVLDLAKKHTVNYILIDDKYKINISMS